MSERKVLNKYYPPDYDPSKIPRFKSKDGKGRNTTFTIRLMAPCNMRCTTCGEYIYKGRKFNSRKEDVDDMNHLGLRIYRFYIKCTACLSEISFRTDPATTDYILEAGATRNFEALAKAEKKAELDEKAYQEEIKLNPMKLLEERTEQSKNEMERMEALEELAELNKRKLKNNLPDEMLSHYQKLTEQEVEEVEKQDEEYIRSVFGKITGNYGVYGIKRIIDEDGADDSETTHSTSKQIKIDNPTDILSSSTSEKDSKRSWEKSIGGLSSKKSLKGMLVKKKGDVIKNDKVQPTKTVSIDQPTSSTKEEDVKSIQLGYLGLTPKQTPVTKNSNATETKANALGSLGMIDYSDSD